MTIRLEGLSSRDSPIIAQVAHRVKGYVRPLQAWPPSGQAHWRPTSPATRSQYAWLTNGDA